MANVNLKALALLGYSYDISVNDKTSIKDLVRLGLLVPKTSTYQRLTFTPDITKLNTYLSGVSFKNLLDQYVPRGAEAEFDYFKWILMLTRGNSYSYYGSHTDFENRMNLIQKFRYGNAGKVETSWWDSFQGTFVDSETEKGLAGTFNDSHGNNIKMVYSLNNDTSYLLKIAFQAASSSNALEAFKR